MTETMLQGRRGRLLAPLVLFVSCAALLAVTIPSANNLIDFHVYVLGGAALDMPETLYTFAYTGQSPDSPLPFVYPPFAAMVFYPLHLLPFWIAGFLWQVAILAAAYGVVRVSQLLVGSDSRRSAALWTAGIIWLEPVRVCLNMGQLGVFLALAVLYAVYSTRWWISGLLVGVAAGIKLTPAITGVYFVGARRWAAAVFSAVVFLISVGLSYFVVGNQIWMYFTDIMGDTSVNPIGYVLNQSWRGGLSRILGHDAGQGVLVLSAVVATAVLALLAWRALGAGGGPRDALGGLLIVQLLGLLVSPISWVHHWIWIVPLIIWLLKGSWHDRPGARLLGWGWLVLIILAVPDLLALAEPSIWEFSRPWYLAWAGLVYVAGVVATFVWIIVTGRRSAQETARIMSS
ncbi:mannosyltransferase [Mycobacterium frederiksbergense]|uniref:mannosyltransferase n=1 Tax=Mycolicibacterium frederiksbergense TaxID=117567 RepID=UPI0021F3217E|nr:mannosyltransferase [Mycolicibacterium frederiksbergense]MCV7048153.1 mannosyltransferase [Mycolicibacterium frederiksbergense]